MGEIDRQMEGDCEVTEGLSYATFTSGPYDVGTFILRAAKAVSKCQWCKGRIARKENYLYLLFIDRGRRFHKRLRFCMQCVGHIHDLKSHANIRVRDDHQERIRKVLQNILRRDRYNIFLEKDPVEEYLKSLKGSI